MLKNNFNDSFWTAGNGKDFINWSGMDIAERDFETKLFYFYDDTLDVLVKKWMKDGDFKAIMKSLHSSNNKTNLPQDFLDFKEKLSLIPSWLDKGLLQAGSELSERSGLTGLLVLRNFALLGGYNFANLTKPLVATGSLKKGAVNRLYNTLNFWVNVSRTHKNAQDLRLNACISTRLVHSASRLMIQQKMPNWNREKYGSPINFADMIATNIAFTVYYLFGLEKLNFNYTVQEEEGIFHLWKYVTFLLGVPVEYIPENRENALQFFKSWTTYQGEPDQDSQKLTESLLQENTPINLFKFDIIKRNMGYIHGSVANYLLDENTRGNLKIPRIRFKNIIPTALKMKNEISVSRESQIQKGNLEQNAVLKDYKNTIA